MKKVLLAAVVLLIALPAAILLLTPSRLIIVESASAQCSFPAAKRFIFADSNWHNFASTVEASSAGDANKDDFLTTVNNTYFVNTGVALTRDKEVYQTNLILIAFNIDSTGIEWRDTIRTGNNPFTKISRYNTAKKVQQKMKSLITGMVNFLSNKSNIYSAEIFKIQETDRPLLSRRVVMNREPTPQDAYDLIAMVQTEAKKLGDPANGRPMKYSSKIDSNSYELIVAIPTARMLPATHGFVPKGRVGGNPIAMDITGGEATIKNAWSGIRQYKEDYRLSSPAIPYEVMVTDRLKETDTSKWKTRIVYPTRL